MVNRINFNRIQKLPSHQNLAINDLNNQFGNINNQRIPTDNNQFEQKISKMKNRDGSFRSKGDRYVNKSPSRHHERYQEDDDFARDSDFNDKY